MTEEYQSLVREYNGKYNKEILEKLKNHELKLGDPLHYYNELMDISGNKLGNLFWVSFYNYNASPFLKRKEGTGVGNIYKIENIINHKKYIGKSKNIYTRKQTHYFSLIKGYHNSIHLQADYYLYGLDAFTFEIIETVQNSKDINTREKHWINEYNTEFPNGYNSPRSKQSFLYKFYHDWIKKYNKSDNIEKENLIKELMRVNTLSNMRSNNEK
jgi:hypothetical protein